MNITKTIRDKGLDGFISGSGMNLSAGEKQLICIVRALLKDNKIVLIDEATSSIDPKTDEAIQKALTEVFVNCTVLTIAHRINTIVNSDRILVMKNGRKVEFAPHKNFSRTRTHCSILSIRKAYKLQVRGMTRTLEWLLVDV